MMSYILSMFLVLVIGAAVLMTGILLINKESEKAPDGLRGTSKDSLVWGSGFFFSFAAEFIALSNLF